MTNVIKPEQLQSSKTPTAGEIPVIDDSTALVLPGSLILSSGKSKLYSTYDTTNTISYLHISSSQLNSNINVVISPSKTSGISTLTLANSNGNDVGYVGLSLIGTTFNIGTWMYGIGPTPSIFQWNGNTIWHSGNAGVSGSGANVDKVDGADASSSNIANTIPIRDSNKTILASIFNSDIATGTPPLTISSRTMVPNLNADLVDGFDASITPTKGQIPVSNGTTGSLQLVNGGASDSAKLLLGRTGSGTYATYGTISTTGQAGSNTGMVLEVNNSFGVATPAMVISASGTVTFPLNVTFTSTTVFNSTIPFTIAPGAAGTIITNLNADLLDGYNATDFLTSINLLSPTDWTLVHQGAIGWTFYSVGPTGSGADIIIPDMVNIPTGTRYIMVSLKTNTSNSGDTYLRLSHYSNNSIFYSESYSKNLGFGGTADNTMGICPINANKIFRVQFYSANNLDAGGIGYVMVFGYIK